MTWDPGFPSFALRSERIPTRRMRLSLILGLATLFWGRPLALAIPIEGQDEGEQDETCQCLAVDYADAGSYLINADTEGKFSYASRFTGMAISAITRPAVFSNRRQEAAEPRMLCQLSVDRLDKSTSVPPSPQELLARSGYQNGKAIFFPVYNAIELTVSSDLPYSEMESGSWRILITLPQNTTISRTFTLSVSAPLTVVTTVSSRFP